MQTNVHILTLNALLNEAKGVVCTLPAEAAGQLKELLDESVDQLLQANTDLSNLASKNKELMETISSLSRTIYEPVLRAQYTYPAENDYNAVREYVVHRREHDEVFKHYCDTHTRTQLCERLTEEFGWVVDAGSYGRNLQRHL